MIDSYTIIISVGIFIIAGTVKGVVGLGLPSISLALLTLAIDLPSAMSIMLVPSFITNIWQAVVGGEFKAILIRIWPLLLFASGKLVCTGAKKESDVYKSVHNIHALLEEKDLMLYNA